MKKVLTFGLVAMFACGPAFAADTKAADTKMTPQQEKMKTCNDQATDMKGDERKAFMKTCLSAKPAPPPKAESKMAMCNKKTAGMKADERAKAQSECMKG
jgi:psiF repeat